MTALSLVKTIARQIKYCELTNLIGQSITIHDVNSVFDDVKRDLQLPDDAMPVTRDEKYTRIGIAKYGLIDIDFTVQGTEILNAVEGFEAIRTLHLYQENPNLAKDDLFLEAGVGFLEEMVEDIEAGIVYLLLYLKTNHPEDINERKIQFKNWSIPDNYFPRKFVVKDAALCNTRFAWLTKHFYL